MRLIKSLKYFLKKFDFFPNAQLLCYKQESSYSTATGGFVSIVIVVIFLALFASAAIQMINKVKVESSILNQQVSEPSFSQITASPDGGFMFVLSIVNINSTEDAQDYFSIALKKMESTTETPIGSMVACSSDHFAFDDTIDQKYQLLKQLRNFSSLCPPLNQTFDIEGSLTSPAFKSFKLVLQRCDSSIRKTCKSEDEYQTFLQNNYNYFIISIAVFNTLINPDSSSNYKSYYVEDRNYFLFNPNSKIMARAEISQYQINTDESISPMQSITTQRGLMIPSLFQYQTVPDANSYYFSLQFLKSSRKTTYNRSYQKINAFFSYIGGLISTVLAFIFIMSFYNEASYFISLANKLFIYSCTLKIQSEKFNFFYFVSFSFYKIIRYFGCLKQCAPMKIYYQAQREIKKQLDVGFLMRRVVCLQRSINLLLDDNQLAEIYAQNRPTLQQAQFQRKKFRLIYQFDEQQDGPKQPKYLNDKTQLQQIKLEDPVVQKQSILFKEKEEDWNQNFLNPFKAFKAEKSEKLKQEFLDFTLNKKKLKQNIELYKQGHQQIKQKKIREEQKKKKHDNDLFQEQNTLQEL